MEESDNIMILRKALDAVSEKRMGMAWNYLLQADRRDHPALSYALGEICYHELVPEARFSDAAKYYGEGYSHGDDTCMTMLAVIHTIEGRIPASLALWQRFLDQDHEENAENSRKILMLAIYIKKIIETDAAWHGSICQLFLPYRSEIAERVVDLFQSDFNHKGRKEFLQHVSEYLQYAFLCDASMPILPCSAYA